MCALQSLAFDIQENLHMFCFENQTGKRTLDNPRVLFTWCKDSFCWHKKKTGITSSSLYMKNLKIMRFFPIFSWFFIKLLPHHLFTAAIKKHWFQLKWIKMKKKKAVIKLCPKNFFNYRLFEVDLYYWEAPRYRGFNEKDF